MTTLLRMLRLVAQILFTIAFTLSTAVVMIGTLGRFSRTLSPLFMRFWGRTMLRISGIRLEVVGGREHVEADVAKVVTFNHGGYLDGFIVSSLMPPGAVPAAKREFLYYPFIGLTCWAFGFLMIDRGAGAKARRTMQKAGERMLRERLTIFIAPEGTRSEDGSLAAFKKGAFHLAQQTGVPVLPMLIDGAFEGLPKGRWWVQPGVVRVRFLAPRKLDERPLGEQADELRGLFLEELPKLRALR